jgi:hypothetical protein
MKSKSVQKTNEVPDDTVRPLLVGEAARAVQTLSKHYTISENAATRMLVLKGWPQVQRELAAEGREALSA